MEQMLSEKLVEQQLSEHSFYYGRTKVYTHDEC